MHRTRVFALGAALAVALAACGGGEDITEPSTTQSSGGGGTTASTAPDPCAGETLEATDVGITEDEITIAVIADTGSTIRPGLFQGSVDAIKAWAEWKNANGGIACREVVVKDYDSKLSPSDAKNSLTSACSDAFVLVGTTALFVNDMSPVETCPDANGDPTGITDFAVLQTEPAQQCSEFDFAVLPGQGTCPYSGTGERTFRVADGPFRYYLDRLAEFGVDQLHGVWVIPADLPSTISASMPGFRYSQELGIELDAEFGASGLATQSAYTPFVQAIKDNESTYARNGLDYTGTVFMRNEAAIQGVDTVKVWDCSLQCYDQRLITEGGANVDGQYVWITFLPLEDVGANATLDAFLEYDDKPDGFGAQAWAAGEAFAAAVQSILDTDGPNGLTRASILEAARNLHDFDAGGMIPSTDIGGKRGSNCFIMMQVQDGEFVRVEPTEPGTFNCDGTVEEITIDPATAFQP